MGTYDVVDNSSVKIKKSQMVSVDAVFISKYQLNTQPTSPASCVMIYSQLPTSVQVS